MWPIKKKKRKCSFLLREIVWLSAVAIQLGQVLRRPRTRATRIISPCARFLLALIAPTRSTGTRLRDIGLQTEALPYRDKDPDITGTSMRCPGPNWAQAAECSCRSAKKCLSNNWPSVSASVSFSCVFATVPPDTTDYALFSASCRQGHGFIPQSNLKSKVAKKMPPDLGSQ